MAVEIRRDCCQDCQEVPLTGDDVFVDFANLGGEGLRECLIRVVKGVVSAFNRLGRDH